MKKLLFLVLFGFVSNVSASQTGMASWYGSENTHGPDGKQLNRHELSAAHPKLPLGTKVKVYSHKTNKTIIVTIRDRGPFTKGRIIDLNKLSALKLGIYKLGVSKVTIEKIK